MVMSNGTTDTLDSLLPAESVLVMVTSTVLSVMAIFSNGVLLYVVIRTTALHTSTNFFIASLAVGEFLTGLFVIPFAGSSAASGDWAFSQELCFFVAFVGVLGPCAASLSLLAVSTDRCLAVSKPLRYASLVTRNATAVIITLVWTVSFLVSLLPLADWGQYSFSARLKVCSTRTDSRADLSHVLVQELLCVFLPVALTVFIVLKTLHHIRSHRRVFAFVPVSMAAMSLPVGAGSRMSAKKTTTRAMRTLLLVSAVFVSLCLPSAVATVACQPHSASCGASPRLLRALLWLSFLNCVVNPVIIMTLNGKFRATLRTLFWRSRRGLPNAVAGDKEAFTISSGLQAILDASLFVNVIQGAAMQEANLRRHVTMTQPPRDLGSERLQPSRVVPVYLLPNA